MLKKPFRILTAVAAYDGHDASVLALNRALLAGTKQVEVIYLGFNTPSGKIAAAALQEGVDAVAVSAYNGGHLQFFSHLCRLLAENAMDRILVFGGGGATMTPQDIQTLESSGVEKIYRPVRGAGNRANVYRGKLQCQIGYRNEGSDVSRRSIHKLRKDLQLDEEHGCDSDIFYNSGPRIPLFINRYRKVLNRLAKV